MKRKKTGEEREKINRKQKEARSRQIQKKVEKKRKKAMDPGGRGSLPEARGSSWDWSQIQGP